MSTTATNIVISPQPGFQESFLRSSADIVIGGGSAGCGKTFVELLESTRYIGVKNFSCVFFRRTMPQITNGGGLWDKSKEMFFPIKGSNPNITEKYWTFPSGAKIKFTSLQHEDSVEEHQGTEYDLIIFDELTHFTEKQFWYMLSRLRSMKGIKPYMRATCNPDPDSFVAKLISWWIDQETGFPIQERAGKLRYFFKVGDNLAWGNTKQEVLDQLGPEILEGEHYKYVTNKKDLIKSITFIPGKLHENKKLLEIDPGYAANLQSQDEITRSRLLDGNWKVRTDGTNLMEYHAIEEIFDGAGLVSTDGRYITCDAARFGKDLCTIKVWQGWQCNKLIIMKRSDTEMIVSAIEKERFTYKIPKFNVLIDQDGVGGGVVKAGRGYKGFSGGAHTIKELSTHIKENYKNLKTQCYYRLAIENINTGNIYLNLDHNSIVIYDIAGNPRYENKLVINGEVVYVKELIKEELRAIKRAAIDMEGKLQINSKEDQKIILARSPDFADNIMMRKWFDLQPKRKLVASM